MSCWHLSLLAADLGPRPRTNSTTGWRQKLGTKYGTKILGPQALRTYRRQHFAAHIYQATSGVLCLCLAPYSARGCKGRVCPCGNGYSMAIIKKADNSKHQLPVATITKDHKPNGLKQRNFIISQFGKPEVQNQGLVSITLPPEDLGEFESIPY